MRSLKYILTILVCSIFFGFSVQAFADENSQSNNSPGALKAPHKTPDFPVCWIDYLSFYGPADVFSYYVERTNGTAAGILRVRTLDVGIPGDLWQAEIDADIPKHKFDVNVGDGNTSTFSGDTFVAPFKKGMVFITYAEGVDVWTAGMYVEICYSRERKDEQDELIVELQ